MITNSFFINKFVFFSRHGNQNFFVREHIIGTEITLRSVLYSSQPIKLQIFSTVAIIEGTEITTLLYNVSL